MLQRRERPISDRHADHRLTDDLKDYSRADRGGPSANRERRENTEFVLSCRCSTPLNRKPAAMRSRTNYGEA
jgi:hypothetical protein